MKKVYSNPTVSVKQLAAETMMAQSPAGGDIRQGDNLGNSGEVIDADARQAVSEDLYI